MRMAHKSFKRFIPICIFLTFVIGSVFFSFFISRNISHAEDEVKCQTAEEKAQCQKDLDDLNAQIEALGKTIATNKDQQASLSRDISILQDQIAQKKLEIQKANNNISSLSNQIVTQNVKLDELSDTLDQQKSALASALQDMNVFDGTNKFINLVLGSKTMSDFFEDADKIMAIQNAINQDLDKIRGISTDVEQVKSSLEDNKSTQEALRDEQAAAQAKIDSAKDAKDNLLTETKGQESAYQAQLKQKQEKAAEIKAALFAFAGGETQAIPFGVALTYAEKAEATTGVPPAMVLAILQQESAFGVNIGKCYLSDSKDGSGYNVDTKKEYDNVMKASRDIEPFLDITDKLGLDPFHTVVSCPIPGIPGYGGAMGPAQFIPSTWMDVEAGAGVSNPWDAEDAIMASSYYLSTLGAGQSYTSQYKAACRYFGSCSDYAYGEQVMARVSDMQDKIDYIEQYGS